MSRRLLLALLISAADALFHSVCSGPHPAGKAALDEALTLLALTRGADAPAPDFCCVCVGLPLENSFESIIDSFFLSYRAATVSLF